MSKLLEQNIKPLKKYFDYPGVVELCINQPGEIWIETVDGWKREKDKGLSLSALTQFTEILAQTQGQKFSEKIPMLATAIPGYGYRILVVAGAMVTTKIAMCIRIAQAQRFDVQGWFNTPYPDISSALDKEDIEINLNDANALEMAVKAKKTIIVAGGTSSGKTTFLNSMLPYMPPDERIVTVQDTEELVVDNPNVVHLIKSKTDSDLAKISYEQIIDAIMRMRPDRILLSELDLKNTAAFLRLSNTGHGGTMATLHAESTERAMEALTMNGALGGLKGGEAMVEKFARKAIDLIVHIKRIDRRSFSAKVSRIQDV